MDFIILTGMSGAGKTQAAHILEDLGYYCIDNMPVAMIPEFAEFYTKSPTRTANVAFIIDVRGEIEFGTLFNEMDQLKEKGFVCRTIFMDCADNVLVNRYKETRRLHPLVPIRNIGIREAIDEERKILESVKARAEYIIDTTNLTLSQLRQRVTVIISGVLANGIVVNCISFGFKYGIVTEADMVFDVRCFRNPFYVDSLRDKTGLDKEVRDYVFETIDTNRFMDKLTDMVDFLIPLYTEEGKSQLIVAIGCTGGKHRSVAIAERLCDHLVTKGCNAVAIHRDIIKKYVGDK